MFIFPLELGNIVWLAIIGTGLNSCIKFWIKWVQTAGTRLHSVQSIDKKNTTNWDSINLISSKRSQGNGIRVDLKAHWEKIALEKPMCAFFYSISFSSTFRVDTRKKRRFKSRRRKIAWVWWENVLIFDNYLTHSLSKSAAFSSGCQLQDRMQRALHTHTRARGKRNAAESIIGELCNAIITFSFVRSIERSYRRLSFSCHSWCLFSSERCSRGGGLNWTQRAKDDNFFLKLRINVF